MDQAARDRVLQLAVWLALLGDLLLLGWWNQILAPAGSVILLLLAVLGCGGLWLLRRGRELAATQLDAGFALLAAAVVASSLASLDPGRSWRAGWQWLACIWLFYLGVLLFRRGWTAAAFSRAVLLVLALIMASAYYQVYLWLTTWTAAGPWPQLLPPGVPRVWGITTSPNIFAVLLNMGLLLLLGYRQAVGRWLPPLLFWLLAALPLLLLPASRSGWLGLLAGLGVFWLAGRAARARGADLLTGRSLAGLLLGALAGLGIVLLLIALLRPGSLTLDAGSDVGFRTRFWLLALDTWRTAPLLGSGLNTYASHYMLRYPAPYGVIYVAAHNLYLQGLAEMGLLGAGALLLLTLQVVRLVWRRRAALADPWPRALLSALAAFAVHALLDTPETWVAALALLCLAALLATLYPRPPARRGVRMTAYAWGALWLLLLSGGLLGNLAARRYAAALAAAETGDWAAATADLGRAARLLPYDDGAILLAQGQIYGALAAANPAYLPQAVDAFERLRALEPGWSASNANLAALYWQQGRPEAALARLAAAQTSAPDSPIYWLNGALWQRETAPAAAAADMTAALALARTWPAAPVFAPYAPSVAAPAPAPAPAEAEAAFAAQAAAEPGQAAAYLGLGIARLQLGDAAGAATALRQAAALDTLGSSLGQGSRLRSAIAVWRALLPGGAAAQQALTARLREQSVYGPGTGAAGSYPTTVFLRPGLPVDLLPQLRCPAVSADWAEALVPAAVWASAAGETAAARWLNDLLLGDGDGTRSCWPMPEGNTS